MELVIERNGSAMHVHPAGNLDRRGTDEFRPTLAKLTGEPFRELTIDFQKVDFIGSSGLALLMEVSRKLDTRGKKLVVTNLSVEVRELFQILNLGKVLSIR